MNETEAHRTWLRGLLESLRRAGLEFWDEVWAEEVDDVHQSTVRLRAPVAKGGMRFLSAYVHDYAAAAGWRATLRSKGHYLTIVCSRARSSSR